MAKTRHILTAYCYDKRGRLISKATNNYDKTHPLMAMFAKKVSHSHKIYLHAEVAALIKAGERSDQIHKIRVERYGKRGTLLPSMPCPICMEALRTFGVTNLEYTI
jgi:tRNA(Arg) A34 adenosine deaminase TadA